MRYWVQLATEQFPPSALVRQATRAERAGFDGLNVSDHYQPWWEPGHSGQAWALLGAIGQATDGIPIGTGVTAPVHRYHPAVVAQFAPTLEELFPGRAFLGIGSGEALNESVCGMDWPDTGEQVAAWRRHSSSSTRSSTAAGWITRVSSSEPRPPACTPAASAGRRSTCRPSGRRRPRSPGGSATDYGRWPTRSRPPS